MVRCDAVCQGGVSRWRRIQYTTKRITNFYRVSFVWHDRIRSRECSDQTDLFPHFDNDFFRDRLPTQRLHACADLLILSRYWPNEADPFYAAAYVTSIIRSDARTSDVTSAFSI